MTVLPGRPWRGRAVADSHRRNAACIGWTECPVAVADQVAWRRVPGKCLCHLSGDSLGLHGCAGRSSSSVTAVVETSAPCISPQSTVPLRSRSSTVRRECGERPTEGWPCSSVGSGHESHAGLVAGPRQARFPAPVSLKAAMVPTEHGLGPHNPDRTKDGRKEPIEPDQQQTVRICQSAVSWAACG